MVGYTHLSAFNYWLFWGRLYRLQALVKGVLASRQAYCQRLNDCSRERDCSHAEMEMAWIDSCCHICVTIETIDMHRTALATVVDSMHGI